MSQTRFGILGCGGASLPVCEAMATSPVAKLTKVHDLDFKLARELGERYGVPAVERLEELLCDPEVEAVYIAVPHDQLYPLARQTLEAGKHALVEKPMALTLAQADDLIALAQAKHLTLGVFYELRHSPAYARARELIQAGAIGAVIGVRIQTVIDKAGTYWEFGYSGRSASPWRAQKVRAGGGVVLMNTSHQLDAVHYLTGLEVVSVSAEVATLVASVEVEDTASITLRYDNGALGSVFAGAHLAGARGGQTEHFDIFGTQGQLRVPDAYGDGMLQVFLRQAWNDVPAQVWHTLPAAPSSVFAGAIDAFAQAAQRGEPAPTSGQDARRVLGVILAVYQAAPRETNDYYSVR